MAEAVLKARQVGWRFALAGSLLLAVWSQVSGLYLASLVAPANWLLSLGEAPLALTRDGAAAVVGLRSAGGGWQVFQLQGQELATVHLVAALSLMLALPGLFTRERAVWSAGLLVLLWGTHVLVLYGGCLEAAGAYLSAPGRESQLALYPEWSAGAIKRSGYLRHLIGGWNAWGCPGLLLIVGAAVLPRPFWRKKP